MTQPALVAPGLGLILDLDGVIVDSMPVHEVAWQEYLHRIGININGYIPKMVGRRNDEIVRELIGATADEVEILAHGAKKEQLYREMMLGQLEKRLVPGVGEFLSRVQNVPVGLASNAELPNVDFILDKAGLRGYFDCIVDGSRVERPKPAPDVYLLAMRELGLAPGNVIVFEDSVVGIEAARKAGARVVGLLTQGITLDNIDLAIQDFRSPELEPWLAAQTPH